MKKQSDHITVTIQDHLNSIRVHVKSGELLLEVLRKSGKPISAPCGGKGSCKKCLVEINNNATVLACRHRIYKDTFVKLKNHSDFAILDQSHHSKIFENHSGIHFAQENGQQTVFFKDTRIAKLPAGSSEKYGLAIDVGTTTVVIFLEDLMTYEILDTASFVNPQTAFGADVISRITHCIEKKDGVAELQSILVTKLNASILKLCKENNIHSEQIYKTTIVGNTVMQHILWGADPRSIAFAPFTPVFLEEKQCAAKDIRLAAHPQGIVKLLPAIAGYVGADIVAGIATTDMLDREEYTLYIDIGTNGEIVLGNKQKMYCCATAAGPAFEGANITFGCGGIRGAVSEFENEKFTTIGNCPAIGICGSGLIDIVAALLDKNQIDMMGYMESDFLIVPQAENAIDQDIVITPDDIREVQLSKAAIFAGITTLLKIADIDFDAIGQLYLAGGFGNYVQPKSAIRIGMLPKALEDKIVPIGNAAGTGARLALKSIDFEKEIDRVVEKSEYIELSMRHYFNDAYVTAMMFE